MWGWLFPLGKTFFGLTSEHKEIYLEPIYQLTYNAGFSYWEAMNLPLWNRRWFINRIIKQQREEKNKSKKGR